MIIERIKIFFISSANWVSANSDEENGRSGVSQMKPARTAGSTYLFYAIFSIICRPASTRPSRCDRATEKVKAFAAGRTRFPNRLGALTHKATSISQPTVCSRPRVAQVCSSQAARSPFGFARPGLSPSPRDAQQCLPIPRSSFVDCGIR